MAPRKTVQDIFGLKPEEVNALAVLSGLEGFRGGANSPDVAAVAANVLSRRLSGQWGGNDIRNIAKAPGQYVAVDNYTMSQLADPSFGARVLGSEAEFNRLRNIVNNPELVGQQFKQSKGAQSFRGVSAYGNKKPEDYMPVPGKSNFYFNGLKGDLYNKGVGLFNQGSVSDSLSAAPVAAAAVSDTKKSDLFQQMLQKSFLEGVNYQSPISKLLNNELLNVLSGTADPNTSVNDFSRGLAGLGFPSLL
jgi:hypothetical protein